MRNSDSGEGLSLNIRLKKSNSDPRTSRAFAPRFPKVIYFFLLPLLITEFKMFNTLPSTGKRWSMVVNSRKLLYLRATCSEESFFLGQFGDTLGHTINCKFAGLLIRSMVWKLYCLLLEFCLLGIFCFLRKPNVWIMSDKIVTV